MSNIRPVIYDVTRLATRVFTDTPNGIDRVDLALAKHFFSRTDQSVEGLLCTASGPTLVSASVARAIIADVESLWAETDEVAGTLLYEEVVRRLLSPPAARSRIVRASKSRFGAAVRAVWKYGLQPGRDPRKDAPASAAYLNASHFPLEYSWHSRWLLDRRDILPAFFIHDLFPVESPQLFWSKEPDRHRQRLANIRRVRGAAVVSSAYVANKVANYFQALDYRIPICQTRPSVSSVFHLTGRPDPRLEHMPFFIVCGTIEPRKNHALLLNVWRELAKQLGPATPKLVIVGKRGWNSESVVAQLERSRTMADHVIEVSGLPTPALKHLMDSARALLAPSFSEGFGLPVAEALTAGLPVIASDIDPVREISTESVCLINPLDGPGWLDAIRAAASNPRVAAKRPGDNGVAFATTLEDFLTDG